MNHSQQGGSDDGCFSVVHYSYSKAHFHKSSFHKVNAYSTVCIALNGVLEDKKEEKKKKKT